MVRVAAGFFNYFPDLTNEIAQLIATSSPSDPHHGFDAISGAPYYSADTSSFTAQSTVQDFEASETYDLQAYVTLEIQSFMQMVDGFEAQLGLQIPVLTYEGGLSLTSQPYDPWYNTYLALQTDPGQFDVTNLFLKELADGGVTGLGYYQFIEEPSQYGEFGSMAYLGEPSSETPVYNSMVSFINSPSLVLTGFPSSTDVAGEAESVTVIAYGANSSGIDTGYTGTIQLTSTDPQAVLPPAYTFTAADAGEHTFTVTLKTAGTQSITVSDPVNGLSRTQSFITVQPAAPTQLVINTQPSSAAFAKVVFDSQPVIYEEDPYGNLETADYTPPW